jgi:hypothetical protein
MATSNTFSKIGKIPHIYKAKYGASLLSEDQLSHIVSTIPQMIKNTLDPSVSNIFDQCLEPESSDDVIEPDWYFINGSFKEFLNAKKHDLSDKDILSCQVMKWKDCLYEYADDRKTEIISSVLNDLSDNEDFPSNDELDLCDSTSIEEFAKAIAKIITDRLEAAINDQY